MSSGGGDELQEPATVVGLLDELLDTGVHVSGDIVLGLADVDLVRVAVKLLVASEETAKSTAAPPRAGQPVTGNQTSFASGAPEPDRQRRPAESIRTRIPSDSPDHQRRPAGTRGDVLGQGDRERLIRGISQLVLTLVEVIRDLLERQAGRRVEGGSLSEEEVERLGIALEALDERIEELKEVFGFTDEELNLDLGPLGRLR